MAATVLLSGLSPLALSRVAFRVYTSLPCTKCYDTTHKMAREREKIPGLFGASKRLTIEESCVLLKNSPLCGKIRTRRKFESTRHQRHRADITSFVHAQVKRRSNGPRRPPPPPLPFPEDTTFNQKASFDTLQSIPHKPATLTSSKISAIGEKYKIRLACLQKERKRCSFIIRTWVRSASSGLPCPLSMLHTYRVQDARERSRLPLYAACK